MIEIHQGDNLPILQSLPSESVDLVYIDPPFNTGKIQMRDNMINVRDENGDRKGFAGRKYKTIRIGSKEYNDEFYDYLGFLEPRLLEAKRIMKANASLFFHIDYREAHYCKILLDGIFGRDSFMNEIIWAYDYGARTQKKWAPKHETIFWYAKDPSCYTFNVEEMDRIPYLAPELVGEEKAERGKTPTDVWWHTIVSPGGRERTGYPNQKPLGIINRLVKVHSNEGDTLLDFFAGSGTLGESAFQNNRNCILIDNNPEAIEIMKNRLEQSNPTIHKDNSQTNPETLANF